MSYFKGISIADSPNLDAFARLRVSEPTTLFDSKQIFDAAPLLWDDQQTSGAGTSSTHSVNRASTTIAVSGATAGVRVRQTFRHFNYQPGKSQLILLTGILTKSGGGAGIKTKIGYFNANNGLFFMDDQGTLKVVRRTYVTGSPVDNEVSQASWNLDPLDGTGPSGITLDKTKTNIFLIDFEWLGVGRVRMGVVIDGIPVYCHEFNNANVLSAVYMSTPNLPLRYEIENTGAGVASELEHICTTVMSEGGVERAGTVRSVSTAGTHLDADAADTLYAVIGLRLKSTALGAGIEVLSSSMISETNGDFEWSLYFNPTVAGTFTYTGLTNSSIERALGATTNTVSGGTLLDSGFAKSSTSIAHLLDPAIKLGSSIAGTPDTMVFCVRPLANNQDIQATISWGELT